MIEVCVFGKGFKNNHGLSVVRDSGEVLGDPQTPSKKRLVLQDEQQKWKRETENASLLLKNKNMI